MVSRNQPSLEEPTTGRRLLPHATEAEASVLGAILLRNDVIHQAAERLRPEDFYHPQHRLVYEAMLALEQAGRPLDPVTLEEELQRTGNLKRAGGMERLLELTTGVPTTENIGHYIFIVRDKAMVRRLIQTTTEIAAQGYGDYGDGETFLAETEQAIFQITQRQRTQSYVHVKPIIQNRFEVLEKRNYQSGELTGVPTGYTEFDQKTNGLQPGDLVILAARPSMGKTSLALNIAAQAAMDHKVPTIVFSLEMTKEQLVERLLCSDARLDMDRLRKGYLDKDDWIRLTDAASNLHQAPIYIDDTPSATLQMVRSKCRRFRSDRKIYDDSEREAGEEPLGLVVIDYLQLMSGQTVGGRAMESREREISEISRGLKAMAKELNMPVMALSQLNRQVEKREDKRPNLSDLRESGAIEQDADVIVFIYRDEFYKGEDSAKKGIAEVIIGKQRNGPTGVCELAFRGTYTRFENLSRRDD